MTAATSPTPSQDPREKPELWASPATTAVAPTATGSQGHGTRANENVKVAMSRKPNQPSKRTSARLSRIVPLTKTPTTIGRPLQPARNGRKARTHAA